MSCSLKTCRWLEQCPCFKKFIHTRTRTKMRKLGPRSLNWANYSIHFSREKMQKDAKSIIHYNQKYCVKKPLRSFVGGVGTASPTHCWVQDMAKTFLGWKFSRCTAPSRLCKTSIFFVSFRSLFSRLQIHQTLLEHPLGMMRTHQHEMTEHLAQRTWAGRRADWNKTSWDWTTDEISALQETQSLVITHHQAKGIWDCWQVHLQCHSETRAPQKFLNSFC